MCNTRIKKDYKDIHQISTVAVPGGERKEYETRRGKTGLSLHYSIVSMSDTHAYTGKKEYEKMEIAKRPMAFWLL